MRPEKEKSSPGTRATGNVERLRVALAREPVDRGAARVAEAEQARALVERLAGGVVERRAERRRNAAVVPHVEQQRVAAAREQAEERRLERVRARGRARRRGRAGGRRARAAGRRDHASAFAAERPTSSAPIRPGPARHGDARRRRRASAPASLERLADAPARRARGGGARRPRGRRRRSARAARPARRRRSRRTRPSRGDERGRRLVARRLEREDHSARRGGRRATGSLPHDQRVLAVVRVVAAPDAASLEAEPLVERDRAVVRDAHLERVAAPAVARGELEQLVEQRRRDAAAAVVGCDGDVHHVPGVDVARDDQVAGELARLASNAPRQIDAGFASSPANIERDHGVGYDARSIRSIASRSRSVKPADLDRRLASSSRQRPLGVGRRAGRSARPRSAAPKSRASARGSAPAGRAARRRRAGPRRPRPRARRGSAPRRRRRTSGPALDLEVRGRQRDAAAVREREHLARARVDHGHGARRAGGERVERRDAGDRDVEREAPAPRAVARPMRRPVKLPGPCRRRAPRARAGSTPASASSASTSSSTRDGARRALAEDLAVADEGARRHVRRGVKREDQHVR